MCLLQHGVRLLLPQHGRGGEPHLPAVAVSPPARPQSGGGHPRIRRPHWGQVPHRRPQGDHRHARSLLSSFDDCRDLNLFSNNRQLMIEMFVIPGHGRQSYNSIEMHYTI